MMNIMGRYKSVAVFLFLLAGTAPAFADANTEGRLSLTLEQCIQIALENNPEAAAVRWDVAAAESRHAHF